MVFFDEYSKIAVKQGYEFGSSIDENRFIIPSDRMVNKKFCYLIKGDLMYFASDSYAAASGLSSTYSGVYAPIPYSFKDFEAEISKHFWFDFIAGGKRVKTGNSYLDKHLRISTNMVEQVSKLVDVRVTDSYLKIWEQYSPVKLVFGPKYLPSINNFKDKLMIGVEINKWVLTDDFNRTFNDFQELIFSIKRKVSHEV
jgi:hypothetical protein